jgi:hypothetical protein
MIWLGAKDLDISTPNDQARPLLVNLPGYPDNLMRGPAGPVEEHPGRGDSLGCEEPEKADVNSSESAERSEAKMIGAVGVILMITYE